jgi:hypothetical protein
VPEDDSIVVPKQIKDPFHMSPMLIVKKKMNTIKQPGKGDNACQRPLSITPFLKDKSLKKLLKTFSMLTCITAQSRCRSRRVRMPKRMAS